MVHGALAAVAVGLAAWAWQTPTGKADDSEVVVLAGKPDDVREVRWVDADSEVTVSRAADKAVQVAVTSKKGLASNAAAPVVAPVRTRVYPGTDAARELTSKLVPFRASRDLGAVGADKATAFGLDASPAKLTVGFGERTETLDVGGTSFGGGSTYVRAGGRVYLVKTTTFNDLKNGAIGLTERALVVVPREKVERVLVREGAKSREVVQRFADDRTKAYYADAAEPDKRLSEVTSWIERLMRTRMVDFTDQKPLGDPQLLVELEGDRKPLGTVKVWAAGEAPMALVESSAFPGVVTIPKATAETLLKDVDAVMSEGK
jgi:hypothetical protein